jgi:hypothetical protein
MRQGVSRIWVGAESAQNRPHSRQMRARGAGRHPRQHGDQEEDQQRHHVGEVPRAVTVPAPPVLVGIDEQVVAHQRAGQVGTQAARRRPLGRQAGAVYAQQKQRHEDKQPARRADQVAGQPMAENNATTGSIPSK